MGIKKLKMGVDCHDATPNEEKERLADLCATVEHYIPEFVKAVSDNAGGKLILHQAAFAAGYHDDECTLFGMALKYAGMKGVEVTVICGSAHTEKHKQN